MEGKLNHFDAAGNAIMVDVTAKAPTHAHWRWPEGTIRVSRGGAGCHPSGTATSKGDVLGVARVAGIMAAKRTSELIPLCHPLMLSHAVGGFRAVLEEDVRRPCPVHGQALRQDRGGDGGPHRGERRLC